MHFNATQYGQIELIGGAEDDQFSLYGGKGTQRIVGGAGIDTIELNYGAERYALEKQGDTWVLHADQDSIRLEGIEQIRWNGQTQTLEQALGGQQGTAGDDQFMLMRHHREYDGGAGIDALVLPSTYDPTVHLEQQGDAWLLRLSDRELLLRNVEVLRFNNMELDLQRDGAKALQPIQQHLLGADGLHLIGNALGTPLMGGLGDDRLEGGGGDDSLYGGKGQDTAVFSGLRSQYEVRLDSFTGQASVRDRVSGRDGNDTLIAIEKLQFADGLFDLEAVAEHHSSQPEPELPINQDPHFDWSSVGLPEILVIGTTELISFTDTADTLSPYLL